MWIWIGGAVVLVLVASFYLSKWYQGAVKDEHRTDHPTSQSNFLDRK